MFLGRAQDLFAIRLVSPDFMFSHNYDLYPYSDFHEVFIAIIGSLRNRQFLIC